jgi:hypothetical protein
MATPPAVSGGCLLSISLQQNFWFSAREVESAKLKQTETTT